MWTCYSWRHASRPRYTPRSSCRSIFTTDVGVLLPLTCIKTSWLYILLFLPVFRHTSHVLRGSSGWKPAKCISTASRTHNKNECAYYSRWLTSRSSCVSLIRKCALAYFQIWQPPCPCDRIHLHVSPIRCGFLQSIATLPFQVLRNRRMPPADPSIVCVVFPRIWLPPPGSSPVTGETICYPFALSRALPICIVWSVGMDTAIQPRNIRIIK